jgi:hypothetical protein
MLTKVNQADLSISYKTRLSSSGIADIERLNSFSHTTSLPMPNTLDRIKSTDCTIAARLSAPGRKSTGRVAIGHSHPRPREAQRGAGSFHGLQKAQHLAEKAKLDPRHNPQGRAANINLDRRCARTALVFRHPRNEIARDNASVGNHRGGAKLAPPAFSMKPVAQRDLTRPRDRRQALRDNRRLLLIAPTARSRRSPSNGHVTLHDELVLDRRALLARFR